MIDLDTRIERAVPADACIVADIDMRVYRTFIADNAIISNIGKRSDINIPANCCGWFN